jgi:CheY-like chemotaxis protein
MNDNGHILVVDDQREICDMVQEYLSGEGYQVSIAQDGAGMRRVLAQSPVDLVTLDLMLPGEDGLTLARWLRENFSVGIVMLTGRGEVVDRIIGLEMATKAVPPPRAAGHGQGRAASGLDPNHGTAHPLAIEGTVRRLENRSLYSACTQKPEVSHIAMAIMGAALGAALMKRRPLPHPKLLPTRWLILIFGSR